MYEDIVAFIQKIYKTTDFIPLHEPKFIGNEKKYLNECIDSTFVSSVGKFVDEFESKITNYIGAKYAVATSNGTSALHISLLLANVGQNDEVITQPLTFVATGNAISYCGAQPVFVDVDKDTMGMSPLALKEFLENNRKATSEDYEVSWDEKGMPLTKEKIKVTKGRKSKASGAKFEPAQTQDRAPHAKNSNA